jgi:hypothetical protein
LGQLKFAAQDVDEGLDGEFDEEKRLGDEIVATTIMDLARLLKSSGRVTKTTGVFLCIGRRRSLLPSS